MRYTYAKEIMEAREFLLRYKIVADEVFIPVPAYYKMLCLYALTDMTFGDVARRMGWSRECVRRHVMREAKRLRHWIRYVEVYGLHRTLLAVRSEDALWKVPIDTRGFRREMSNVGLVGVKK